VKKYAGSFARTGSIIVRQRGSKIRPGTNVKMGSDDTLFSVADGIVSFSERTVRRYTGAFKTVKFANVTPLPAKTKEVKA